MRISRRRYDRSSEGFIWWCLVVVCALVSAFGVCGPSLYWTLNKSLTLTVKSSCPPCTCHCPPPLSLFHLAPWLANLSVSDCVSNDKDVKQEMEKQFKELVNEEVKLQDAVGEVQSQHMNRTLDVAKRVASEYQNEADKCIAATETCEQAREHAEAMLIQETKLTLLWQKRASQMIAWEGQYIYTSN